MNTLSGHADNEALQFDQFARYTVLSDMLKLCFEAGMPTLLDVGAGPSELTPRFLANFYKERVSTDVEDFGSDDIVVVPPGASLPYPDGHFDATIAMDVLEHVRPEHRDHFIAEMIRVGRLAVISTPIGCDETRLAESIYAAGYHELFHQPLTFLEEHTTFGLPVSSEVIAIGHKTGARAFTTDCAPLDEWLASNLIDLYLSTVNDGYNAKRFVARRMNQDLPLRRPGAMHYRRFYVFTRDETLASRLADLPPPAEPTSGTWDARGAQLIMARLFRDYAAAYDAPFVDEERRALRDKDLHIEGLTALIRQGAAAATIEEEAMRQKLVAAVTERAVTKREFAATVAELNEVRARVLAFQRQSLLGRLRIACRNSI